MKRFVIVLIIGIFILTLLASIIRADQLDDVTKQLEALKTELNSKEANYQKINQQLNEIKNKLNFLAIEIQKKEVEVKKGEEALVFQKNLLNARARNYYKNISKNSFSLINLFVGENLSKSLQNFFYQKALVDEDKNTIIRVVLYIKRLEEIKVNLESEKSRLALLKKDVDVQATILNTEIASTRSRVAELSALQQQLIAQKLASLNISRSAYSMGRCDSDLTNGRDPGFSPKFGFFTYGVPNRVGLNQWGAYGRAKREGQNEETILHAYYDFSEFKSWDTNININVDGYGTFSLEDYMKRIYEVPDSWGADGIAALKAQAIAARSYVLAYTNNGANSICATESCQVFHADPKGGFWEQAVNDTKGKVMVKDGSPIKAWFSSTHGGYVLSSGEVPGWSATSWTKHANDFSGSVNNFSDLQNNAYDKDSPWFYCDWGSRTEFNKTAWLRPNEVADIVNTILLAKIDSSTQEHLYQPDSPPAGVDVWDTERVKSELRSRGGNPYNNISDVSMSVDFGSGKATSVNVSGDGGSSSFDAGEFKNFFNLRAPANIQIVGPLYNAEKR